METKNGLRTIGASVLVLGMIYTAGIVNQSWSGLSVLTLIWILGLGIITLGIFLAERFGKKWAPLLVIGMLSGFTILADIGCTKFALIKLGGWELIAPAGSLLFAVLYFGGDYLNELYGKETARFNVYAGFLAKLAVALGLLFIIYLMTNPSDPLIIEKNRQFDALLSLGPRLNIMSIIAIVIAGLVNVEIFHTLRRKTKEKHLWLRSFASSATAILVDNLVFTFGSFLFILPAGTIWNMAWTTTFVHLTIALWALPYLYVLRWLKREGFVGAQEQLTIGIIQTGGEKHEHKID